MALARRKGVLGTANAADNTRRNPSGRMLLNRRRGEARDRIRLNRRRARLGHILHNHQ